MILVLAVEYRTRVVVSQPRPSLQWILHDQRPRRDHHRPWDPFHHPQQFFVSIWCGLTLGWTLLTLGHDVKWFDTTFVQGRLAVGESSNVAPFTIITHSVTVKVDFGLFECKFSHKRKWRREMQVILWFNESHNTQPIIYKENITVQY